MLTTAMSSKLNPQTAHYEFLGPPGAFAISVGVPIATYLLYFGCSEKAGGCPPNLDLASEHVLNAVTNLDWWKGLWDTEASLIYFSWYAFCVVAWAVLPGDQVAGTTLRTGGKKQYKINGTVSEIPTVLKHLLIHNTFQHFLHFCWHWESPLASSNVSGQNLSPLFTTNGLASSPRHSSTLSFRQPIVTSLLSERESSWPLGATLEISSMTSVLFHDVSMSRKLISISSGLLDVN